MQKQEALQTDFHTFLDSRKNKANFALQEAQKLVNLYRILNVLGENFVDEYNTTLLGTSDEILMALNTIVGGKEVRQYFDFLAKQQHKNVDIDDASILSKNTGWLPSPEDEANQRKLDSVSSSEWNAFVKAEDEKITELIATLKQEQLESFKHLADQLTTSMASKSNTTIDKKQVPHPQYSEIIEDIHKERP